MFYNARNCNIKIDDTDMDYISFGNGNKSLVIIPGLGDALKTVKGSAVTFALMYKLFAKDYKVYVFSRKNKLKQDCSTRDMATDLADVMNQLNITKAFVLGVSQGGMIAQYLAIDYPELVEKLVLAALKENAERTIQFKPDRIGRLVDIQAKLKQGKGIGYERWAKKHNLKAMSQTLILLQEKGLLNEDALDQRITELDTKFHESLAVVKDLENRMAENKNLRNHIADYQQYLPLAQKLQIARHPAAFEEQHRAELTAYRTAVAYFKANNITKLPSPNKLEAEYCALASEKAQFYEQYKDAKTELLKLKDAKQNVALFFREDERTQHHER